MKNEVKIDHTKPVFVSVWNDLGDKYRRIYLFSLNDRHYCVPVEKHAAYLRGEKVNAVSWENIEFIKEKKQVIEPWTFETCPWPLHFKFAVSGICITVLRKESGGVIYLDSFYRPRLHTYIELIDMDGITCLDGSPCGIVREVDA